MLKLYKEINGVLHYWETWDEDDKTGLVNWGTIRENEKKKKVKSTRLKNFHKIIQQEINEKINEGYEQIDEDDLKFLIIEYKLNSDFGNEEDLEKRHRLEAKMNEDLGWNLSLGNWLFSHGRRGQGNTGSRCSNSKSPHGVHFTDRKSTRLNSSHQIISYAVFCLKKKKQIKQDKWGGKQKNKQEIEVVYS